MGKIAAGEYINQFGLRTEDVEFRSTGFLGFFSERIERAKLLCQAISASENGQSLMDLQFYVGGFGPL